MHPGIPEKTYYKIGEVASIAELKSSVLRFWEAEFPFLSPEKSSTGQRLYTKQTIDLILQIKQLLYQEKYTIEGVRKKLATGKKRSCMGDISKASNSSVNVMEILKQVRQELLALKESL